MITKQISVFVANTPGRLSEVIRIISDAGCNILALTIADTTDFGILRLITDDSDKADAALREHGLAASLSNVLSVCVPDRVGGLSEALATLSENGIAVEYMYVFVSKECGTAQVVMRVDDPVKAQDVLKRNGYNN